MGPVQNVVCEKRWVRSILIRETETVKNSSKKLLQNCGWCAGFNLLRSTIWVHNSKSGVYRR